MNALNSIHVLEMRVNRVLRNDWCLPNMKYKTELGQLYEALGISKTSVQLNFLKSKLPDFIRKEILFLEEPAD